METRLRLTTRTISKTPSIPRLRWPVSECFQAIAELTEPETVALRRVMTAAHRMQRDQPSVGTGACPAATRSGANGASSSYSSASRSLARPTPLRLCSLRPIWRWVHATRSGASCWRGSARLVGRIRWPSRLVATAAEDRLNFRRRNPHTSFAAVSDCRTIAIYDYTA